MELNDSALLRAYVVDHDGDAFRQLVNRHMGWITTAATRRLGDVHLADDAAQAVFILLGSKSEKLVDQQQASIAAWLFHVMHLTCTRLRRSRDRRQRIETIRLDESPRRLPDDDLRAMLEDAIAQLPALDRQAVVRRFYQRQDYKTIAAEMRCSAEAVRKRITRSLSLVRQWMLRDGVDTLPDELLAQLSEPIEVPDTTSERKRARKTAQGADVMMQQEQMTDFTIWSAEFCVKDVEANLEFFEKLGFRRHFIDQPDAMNRIPRASLRGGKTARIWLRQASEDEGTRPTPGMTIFFWIEGGADALQTHRDLIAAQGLKPSAFFDDISLRNFTVTSPDGYAIGFFTAYR